MQERPLKVVSVTDETPLIRRIVFMAPDGRPLAGYTAGAHITLSVPEVGQRKYSLVNLVHLSGGTAAPRAYILGVRRDDQGEGGSRFMHTLKAGDLVSVSGPANEFAMLAAATPVLLLGGGIGITPLITMAAEMHAAGRPFRMIYAARSRSEMAFLEPIEALAGPNLHLHCDDTAGGILDIEATMAALASDVTVYACGPKPMLKAAVGASRKLKWPANRLKFELFYSVAKPAAPAAPQLAPGSFEVQLKSSGKVYVVPPDKSILDTLIAAGVDAVHDCTRGECGVCQTGVISGEPDHRDSILSASERAANKVMQICISRSKSARLVLDL